MAELVRTTFTTSREMEFFTEKELNMQVGHERHMWPLALTKELIDNALDASESAGIAPVIQVWIDGNTVTIADNGPGLPYATFEKSLDYMIRVSDKNHYISPTRGQLGNALKCVWAAPYVYSGWRGCTEVITASYGYRIEVRLDRLADKPKIELIPIEDRWDGTFVKIEWNQNSSASGKFPELGDFYKLVLSYATFNPHATIWFNDQEIPARSPDFAKWTPNLPTSAHWYDVDRLSNLIRAYLADGQDKTVREFVSEFRGLSASAKQKSVTEAAELSGCYLSDLLQNGDSINDTKVSWLMNAMQDMSEPVKGKQLGILGKQSMYAALESYDVSAASMDYAKEPSDNYGLPFVVEVGFAVKNENDANQTILWGLNWTPALSNPFLLGDYFLNQAMIDDNDPVVIIVHVTCPRLDFTDRGKSKLNMSVLNDAFYACLSKATKGLRKYKKTLKRQERISRRALDDLRRENKSMSKKEAANRVMTVAYLKASSNNTLPANARQVYYAARPSILEMIDETELSSTYFTQTLLPNYINQNPLETDKWDVVYDRRGHLSEPHKNESIGIGTLAIRQYIDDWTPGDFSFDLDLEKVIEKPFSTEGPQNRYRFALFLEKEGFDSLLAHAQIAERYDLAIFSTKGMSNTASRLLVDHLSKKGVTILVLHDFDKAGFAILKSLQSSNRRYTFSVKPKVIDLGLRLTDVEEMGLDSESVTYVGNTYPFRALIDKDYCTQQEADFLCHHYNDSGKKTVWYGDRVELNAMTSKQFIDWLERKLKEVGIEKVIPDEDTLDKAYRRAIMLSRANRIVADFVNDFDGDSVVVPDDIAKKISAELETDKALSWDVAIMEIAKKWCTDNLPDDE